MVKRRPAAYSRVSDGACRHTSANEENKKQMKKTNCGLCWALAQGWKFYCLPTDSCPKECLSRDRRPGRIWQLDGKLTECFQTQNKGGSTRHSVPLIGTRLCRGHCGYDRQPRDSIRADIQAVLLQLHSAWFLLFEDSRGQAARSGILVPGSPRLCEASRDAPSCPSSLRQLGIVPQRYLSRQRTA